MLVAALGLLGRDATAQVVSQVQAIAPGSSAEFVRTLIGQAQANSPAPVWARCSDCSWRCGRLGLRVGLHAGIERHLRHPGGATDLEDHPDPLGVTVFAVFVMIVSAVIVVVSGPVAEQVGGLIGAGDTALLVWGGLKWPVLLVLVSVLFAVLFWASPNANRGESSGSAPAASSPS